MQKPKITVIIPTRERCDVLQASLRTATAQGYDNLEIVVSDNFSQDRTRDVVESANDKRIKYLNTGRRLSMSHNWEFALSQVEDGWVTFIGDDDGLPSGAVSTLANIINRTGALAIRSRFCAYDWPSHSQTGGRLRVPMGSGVVVRDSLKWLRKVMQGRASYTELPMIYNGGFIHISVLKELKRLTGSYFLSAIPDIYSGVAISRLLESYVFCEEPLAISGASWHSTGNSFYSQGVRRNPAPSLKFSGEDNLPFHADIPMCRDGSYPRSLHAMTYESHLQAAALHRGADGVSPAQQLEVILRTAGTHIHAIEEWCRDFAALHGLDYEKAKRKADMNSNLLRPAIWTAKLLDAANTIVIGPNAAPLLDVYEASVATSIIRLKPSRTQTILKLLYNQLLKN